GPRKPASVLSAIRGGRYGQGRLLSCSGSLHYHSGVMNKRSSLLAIVAVAAIPFSAAAQRPTLTIQVNHPTAKVSPMLYGLMTEEINHSYDGGVYAELVNGRSIAGGFGSLTHWQMVVRGDSAEDISIDSSNGPSAAQPRSLKLTVTAATESAPAGVENDGYWGMAVHPNSTYTGSFWAKTDTDGVPVSVSLQNDATGVVAAKMTVSGLSSEWKEYKYTLKTGSVAASANNHLILTIPRPATVWLDLISLFPPTYHNDGITRPDIMNLLAAMHPKFLRMPGGNYLEGNSIAQRFDWKKTIGPWVDRPTHMSPWRYRSSDGMGLLEFLQWCQDLHMQPLLAVYAGYSLNRVHVNPGPDLQPYVQDALDEIQYVTGSADTKWGAERVKDGHPAPFPLKYVEVGNEDEFDRSGSYDGRFAQFYRAIKQAYPNLEVVATAPVKSVTPDVLDEHYYMTAQEAFKMAYHYDGHPRTGPKIFVGEWATREGDPTPNLHAALGDAAFLTGLERNSDLIVMSSYAPLFVNVDPGGMQWPTDLIGYNALSSFGSVSYWMQVMFSDYLGTEVLDANLADAGPRVFTSVTRNPAGHKIYIKIVNANSNARTIHIALDGASHVAPTATLVTLSAKTPNAVNSIQNPRLVVPVKRSVSVAGANFEENFAPYSINVLELTY
ncbi:MAG TPA: alpha-L-arabinofuranosidase C-terminal domain-containing protein, partial [Candidatus Acidoferrales bacterium]|nr:alpha-L-arabinofuranosidase C-terminal domain-containing protein [Candidatus Acidoferrales bacterium]